MPNPYHSKQREITVDPGRINMDPGPYFMSFGFSTDKLAESISRIGLVNLPIVVESDCSGFDIISGYRRICALQRMGKKRITCRDLSGCGLSQSELLLIGFCENLGTRRFNHVEKGMVLKRLSDFISRQEVIQDYMPLLDLKPRESVFEEYLAIENGLSLQSKKELACGGLSLQAVRMVLDMDEENRESILEFVANLKFNLNQQKELIDIIVDLSNISKRPIPKILAMDEVRQVSDHTRMNNPQKCKNILNVLRRLRFPSLTAAERAFKEHVGRLDLPPGVRIEAPPFFEAPYYRMQVFFKDGHSLQQKIKSLSHLEGIESLGDPWEERD